MATIEQLTPNFLSSLLNDYWGGDGPEVSSVDARQIGTGQMGRCYQLSLTYSGEVPADTPARVLAKLPSTDDGSRQFATAMQAYAREVEFYREVAPRLSVRTPACYGAGVSADGSDFHLLLEDLSPVSACDQIGGCDAQQAKAVLSEMAALHAESWRNPQLQKMPFLQTGLAVWHHIGSAVQPTSKVFVQRFAERLDDSAIRMANEIGAGGAADWFAFLKEPRCLWHSDLRLDNVLFEGRAGEVPVALVDWQSVCLAPGSIDASYFIGSGMGDAVRRAAEDDLLRFYYERLRDGGVHDYSWDQCQREYRANAVAGFLVAMFASVSVEQTERGDEMFSVLANRHAQHMVDHDSLKSISALAR